MEAGGQLPRLHILWDWLFQLAMRRQVLVSSVVGLCGFGLFWGTRRFLALNRFETQLLKQHGITISDNEESDCF